MRMSEKRAYGGLDSFRLIAAFLVIAIHTSPLLSVSAGADFFLTRVLARVAVPFFFAVTGQFVLSGYVYGENRDFSRIWKYILRILAVYAISIVIYLPVGLYAGNYSGIDAAAALRLLVFDGTFYHLWYFPALIEGILIVCLLSRFMPARICAVTAAFLYAIGLFGDSYYGIAENIPALAGMYDFLFEIFSYTRNGLFFAPIFLLMGAYFGRTEKTADERGYVSENVICFAAAFLAMTFEGFVLRYFGVQRHDSMYIMLPVCMFFLYRLLLSWRGHVSSVNRKASTFIYVLHPGVIVAVRLAASVTGTRAVLVENSLGHYIAVAAVTAAASYVLALLLARILKKRKKAKAAAETDTAEVDDVTSTFDFCERCGKNGSIGDSQHCGRSRTWIELDKSALYHNIEVLKALVPESCRLMPAVKANAYGHGSSLVTKAMQEAGVTAFCVACADEAVKMRENGIKGDILILGYTHPENFGLLYKYDIVQTVVDFSYARELNKYGKKLRVHIGIDTGMHRLGEPAENIENLKAMFAMENLQIEGALTHLCVSDSDAENDIEFTNMQIKKFFDTVEVLKKDGCNIPKVHLQASYGVLNYPEIKADYARVGIAVYGMKSGRNDYDKFDTDAKLEPVLSLKTRVSSVRELAAGEGAGYGLAFTADKDMKIAALAIGYADGLPRALSGGAGKVLINGRRAKIIGRVCMDQTIVDVTDIPDVCAGDTAVIIGRSGNDEISAYEVAEDAGTITNELLSRLGERIERVMV